MLWKALGICPGDMVAFTGGGGKTSLAMAVAGELEREGRPAIFTTTTRIFPPASEAMDLVLLDDHGSLDAVASTLSRGRSVCVGQRVEAGTGKVAGLMPGSVEALRTLVGDGAVLVEADGSAGRPLKAPAAHEPVIPACCDLVVPVAGLTVLGRPLGSADVHRPQEVAAAAGVTLGSPVTPAVVAAALHASTRGRPPGARVVPVLGQGDTAPGLLAHAAAVADLLLDAGAAGRVVVAAPQATAPVIAVYGRTDALVLAGGVSRRFGAAKLLHPWAGRTVLEASLQAPLRAGVRQVAVVTGAYHDQLEPLLRRYPVQVVPNPGWAEGMAASLRAGLAALAGVTAPGDPEGGSSGAPVPAASAASAASEALIICLGDQPMLPPSVVAALADEHRRTGARVIASASGGTRRNPVLFGRSLFTELAGIRGDEGGRSLLRRHEDELRLVEFPDPDLFRDIDSPDDLPAG